MQEQDLVERGDDQVEVGGLQTFGNITQMGEAGQEEP